MRPSNRNNNEMRSVEIETDITMHAEGSCIIKCGDTHVLCTASVEERVPPFLRNSGLGWVTGEYGMLPGSTSTRNRREATSGKQSGRTQEIQRLIGRSLRACIDRRILGERQITIDCDVIQADGGTRCASITGGWVALKLATNLLLSKEIINSDPIVETVAAVSCGIYANQALLDLDYAEDSEAGTDANFVLTESNKMIEVQGSAEGAPFTRSQLNLMTDLAEKGVQELVINQKNAVRNHNA
ncbi:MAG: ribonuclease PH [Rhodobacteraceae bacterium]|nr:ribonuclease PH [Paracoccaceae bacterium]MBC66535.1 ribonuclease PH [Paracoccaceae bacterium]